MKTVLRTSQDKLEIKTILIEEFGARIRGERGAQKERIPQGGNGP